MKYQELKEQLTNGNDAANHKGRGHSNLIIESHAGEAGAYQVWKYVLRSNKAF